MSLISVRNLTFSYDGGYKNVFENVSFQIDTEWKLGFVGRNGRGKTTFLNLLLGKYEYAGKIAANVEFTYFPFEVRGKKREVSQILQELCPAAEEWEFIRELSYLQTSPEILYRPFSELSSGEQTKILLAGLFLKPNNFLLIDEPTNHLDADARQTVSNYLKKKKGFILVSHDRLFLDGCVDHILSINKTNIEVQAGNFSSWFENFENKQKNETAQNKKLKNEIAKLKEAAKRTASWAAQTEASKYGVASSGLKPDRGYVGHKAAKLMKQAKNTEARQLAAIEQKSELLQNAETADNLKLSPLVFRHNKLLEFSNLEINYGNKKICPPVSFALGQGERIALQGKNGCGKSSVLKLALGENVPHTGTVYLPSGLIISYVSQTNENLKGTVSHFAKEHKIDESLFRAILNKMGFSKTDCDGDISMYSEGQKKKVALAKSLCEKAHIYVWDEPLNYLDIYSRMQIEKLILEYRPAMLFVEHDIAFQNAVATKTVKI